MATTFEDDASEGYDHTIDEAAIIRAVAVLDGLTGHDPEADHGTADDVMMDLLPDQIQEARQRLMDRCGWWATA